MNTKRTRGRPKGTGIKDDRHLDEIADLLVKNPIMKKTPAIARVVEKRFPAHKWAATERRLLRKWNITAAERMAAAEERQLENRKSRRVLSPVFPTNLAVSLEGLGALQHEFDGLKSKMSEIAESLRSPLERFADEQTAMARRMQQASQSMTWCFESPLQKLAREQAEQANLVKEIIDATNIIER